jgi:hypothetical protein
MEQELIEIIKAVKRSIDLNPEGLDVITFDADGGDSIFFFQFPRKFLAVNVNGWPAYFKSTNDTQLTLMVTPKRGDLVEIITIKI